MPVTITADVLHESNLYKQVEKNKHNPIELNIILLKAVVSLIKSSDGGQCFNLIAREIKQTAERDLKNALRHAQGDIDKMAQALNNFDRTISNELRISRNGNARAFIDQTKQIRGESTIDLEDGSRYIGECMNGAPFGRGVFIFSSGIKYEGHFHTEKGDLKISGNGISWSPGGKCYYARFYNDGSICLLERNPATSEPVLNGYDDDYDDMEAL